MSRAEDRGRGSFAVSRKKSQPTMRPGKTAEDRLPVGDRPRVIAARQRLTGERQTLKS
jgi:hypothetical protein